jgi:hypothetical protein
MIGSTLVARRAGQDGDHRDKQRDAAEAQRIGRRDASLWKLGNGSRGTIEWENESLCDCRGRASNRDGAFSPTDV